MYLGSSLSSLRNRCLISGGISGGCSGFSSTLAGTASSSFLPSALPAVALAGDASSFGCGVAAGLGWSSSSPMTNSGSNSDGSGPLPAGAALLESASLDRAARVAGERVRELERRAEELDRDGVVGWVAFWRACSSAILASMAPRRRCVQDQLHYHATSMCALGTWNMVTIFYEITKRKKKTWGLRTGNNLS